jgi:hypothetical protein
VVAEAELLGNGFTGQAFDEESMQGGVTTMHGLCGFEEEAAAECIIHDCTPELRVTFFQTTGMERTRAPATLPGQVQGKS